MLEFPDVDGIRVRLTELRVQDAHALLAAATDRSSPRSAHIPDSADAMAEYVRRALDARRRGHQLPLVIRVRRSGKVLGTTRFHHLEPWQWPGASPPVSGPTRRGGLPDVVEIGSTWLAPRAQGSGVNAEAKLLMLRHAFDVWRVHRVRFRTDARNVRSRRAIERLGARLDGVLRADFPGSDGRAGDSAVYSIIAAEWPQVHRRLVDRVVEI